MKVILSGGGTGGHIYPAVAVAEALKRRRGDGVELLFVGARGKMEMEKIPALGYGIVGLPVAGLQRRLDPRTILRNLAVPFKAAQSLRMARRVIRDFGADVVVGFGGYASAPVLRAAQGMGIPTVIQEQNSYAGLTNKVLGRRAKAVCVAYDGMERFFPADRITKTGNPLREGFNYEVRSTNISTTEARKSPRSDGAGNADGVNYEVNTDRVPTVGQGSVEASCEGGNYELKKKEALVHFGLQGDRPTLLVVGGSLGCRTFNEMMKRAITDGTPGGVNVIWQTGKYYAAEMDAFMQVVSGNEASPPLSQTLSSERRSGEAREDLKPQHTEGYVRISNSSGNEASPPLSRQIWRGAFIDRMDLAYAAADLVISRSGANTVSELALLGKPVLFVPSPGVAEDHQTKNAMALVECGAAAVCSDSEAVEKALSQALKLLGNPEKLAVMSNNIRELGIPDSADRVAEIVISSLRS